MEFLTKQAKLASQKFDEEFHLRKMEGKPEEGGVVTLFLDTELENMNPDDLEKQLTKFEEINRKSKEYENLVGKFIDHEEDFDTYTFKLLFQDVDKLAEMEKEAV